MVLFFCKINGRARSKKNSKQIARTRSGRPFITSSVQYKQWAIYAGLFIRKALPSPVIDYPVKLYIKAFYKNKQHQQDADNVAASICDVLQDNLVIKNDHLIHHLDVQKFYDSEKEFIEIKITPLDT